MIKYLENMWRGYWKVDLQYTSQPLIISMIRTLLRPYSSVRIRCQPWTTAMKSLSLMTRNLSFNSN